MFYIELPADARIKTDDEGYCIIETTDGSPIKAAEVVQDYLNGRASPINVYPSCPNEDKPYLEYLNHSITKDAIEKPSLYWTEVNGREKNTFQSRVLSISPFTTKNFFSAARKEEIEREREETREDRRTKGPKSV